MKNEDTKKICLIRTLIQPSVNSVYSHMIIAELEFIYHQCLTHVPRWINVNTMILTDNINLNSYFIQSNETYEFNYFYLIVTAKKYFILFKSACMLKLNRQYQIIYEYIGLDINQRSINFITKITKQIPDANQRCCILL